MRKFAIGVVLVTQLGCASSPYWVKTHEPLPDVVVHTIRHSPWPGVQGWVIRDKEHGTCHVILVEYGVDRECVEAHERKHCAGWDHPDYRYNLDCARFQPPSIGGGFPAIH